MSPIILPCYEQNFINIMAFCPTQTTPLKLPEGVSSLTYQNSGLSVNRFFWLCVYFVKTEKKIRNVLIKVGFLTFFRLGFGFYAGNDC